MAFPYFKAHKALSPPGGQSFLLLDARPVPADLVQPPALDSASLFFSANPSPSLDPLQCWDDVISIINARVVGPYNYNSASTNYDGSVGAPVNPQTFAADFSEQTRLIQRNPKSSIVWTRNDILAARNTLREINAEVIFKPFPKLWSRSVIRDLLEPRWVLAEFTGTTSVPGGSTGDFLTSLTFEQSNFLGIAFTNTYHIDMQDGYGSREFTIARHTKVTPAELLQRWAEEDSFEGDNIKPIKGVVLDYRPPETNIIAANDSFGFTLTVKCLHATPTGIVVENTSSIFVPPG